MTSRIPTILSLYNLGFLSHEQVIGWADKQLLNGSESFEHICELSLKGPDKCLKLSAYDFPSARELSYKEEFAIRLVKLNDNYDLEVDNFIRWIARAAMGLNIEQPEVHLGYLVDHYFFECEDLNFANRFLRKEVASLLPSSKLIADAIWKEIY